MLSTETAATTTTTATTTTIRDEIQEMGRRAKHAALELSSVTGKQKQKALEFMKTKLLEVKDEVMIANAKDVAHARDVLKLSTPMIKRLTITDKVFNYMISRLEKVCKLEDPVGKVLQGHVQPTGLKVEKVSVAIGVIGIIYESRPNVTTDAASVCLKSGNAVILRGGSESINTNMVLAKAMSDAIVGSGLPKYTIQLVQQIGHESVTELLKLEDYVDVIIPRGGKGLIQKVSQETKIPVIKHYDGICHQYIASDANIEWAINLTINSKCQSIEVCNALETLLIDETYIKSGGCRDTTNDDINDDDSGSNNNDSSNDNNKTKRRKKNNLVFDICKAFHEKGVEIRGCPKLCQVFSKSKTDDDSDNSSSSIPIVPATEDDWSTEYLAPIISIKIVNGIEEAIRHINHYGSQHTDGIITESLELSRKFVNSVDSASVLVNASTRLSGGGDYGMGSVVGISTNKLHARGPVGASDLTTYKWIAYGQGHLRD